MAKQSTWKTEEDRARRDCRKFLDSFRINPDIEKLNRIVAIIRNLNNSKSKPSNIKSTALADEVSDELVDELKRRSNHSTREIARALCKAIEQIYETTKCSKDNLAAASIIYFDKYWQETFSDVCSVVSAIRRAEGK